MEIDGKLYQKYWDEIMSFRAFCQRSKPENLTEEELDWFGDQPFEEENWSSLTLGFLIAKGVPFIDASNIEMTLMYSESYWEQLIKIMRDSNYV